MAYFADTHGASATAGADMAAIIKAAITSVSGWSFVETYTSGAHVVDIYKSAAAQNGVRDFYLFVYLYGPNDIYVMVKLAETYDAGANLMYRYVPRTGASIAPDPDADYTIKDTNGESPDGSDSMSKYLYGSADGWSYWMSITAKRVVLATRHATSDWSIYAGLCDNVLDETAHPSSAVALLLSSGTVNATKSTSTTPDNSGGGFTREPGQASTGASNFSAFAHEYGYCAWPYVYGVSNDDTTVYRTDGKRIASRCGLSSCRDGSLYYLRALFPEDVIYLPGTAAAAVNGDTVTIGAKTYVRMLNKSLFVDNSV